MTKKEIGQYLSKTRKQKKISTYSIEKDNANGLFRHQIRAIENGSNNYSIDSLLDYSLLLGVEVNITEIVK